MQTVVNEGWIEAKEESKEENKKGERAGSKRGREEGWIGERRVQKRLEKSRVKERQNTLFDFVVVILNVHILSLTFILHLLKIFIVNKQTNPHLDSIKISKK